MQSLKREGLADDLANLHFLFQMEKQFPTEKMEGLNSALERLFADEKFVTSIYKIISGSIPTKFFQLFKKEADYDRSIKFLVIEEYIIEDGSRIDFYSGDHKVYKWNKNATRNAKVLIDFIKKLNKNNFFRVVLENDEIPPIIVESFSVTKRYSKDTAKHSLTKHSISEDFYDFDFTPTNIKLHS